MSRSLTSGMLAVVTAAALTPILFVEIDTPSGNAYAWSGLGTINWNSIDWIGAGELMGVDAVPETVQVEAAGTQITLSGVPAALAALALEDLRRYYPAKIWFGALDTNFAIISDPVLIFSGRVDAAKISDTGDTSTIIITAESRLIDLKRSRERRYTDQDQKIEHPSDDGFQYVAGMQDATIGWGSTSANPVVMSGITMIPRR